MLKTESWLNLMSDDETLPAQPGGTALALILAAERPVAEHGSAIITLRDITKGRRGRQHLGDPNIISARVRRCLRAVFQYRVSVINVRRHVYLDQLAQTDRLLDQRSLVGALVHPLAEGLVPPRRELLPTLPRTDNARDDTRPAAMGDAAETAGNAFREGIGADQLG